MPADETTIDVIRASVRQICDRFGEDYWLEMDRTLGYPTEFVAELTEAGFLGVLIPESYGGAGLGAREAAVVMEEDGSELCCSQIPVLHSGTDAQPLRVHSISISQLRTPGRSLQVVAADQDAWQ